MTSTVTPQLSTISSVDNRLQFFLEAIAAVADEKAHFARSASPYLLPIVTAAEALEALEAYSNEPSLAYKAVQPAFFRLEHSLKSTVAQKFASEPVFVQVNTFSHEITSRSTNSNDGALKAYLSGNKAAIASATEAARDACNTTVYVSELVDLITASMNDHQTSDRSAYKVLDRCAKELVAFLLAQGRTPALFLATTTELFEKCNNDKSKFLALQRLALEEPSNFQVAVVIDGTARTKMVTKYGFHTVTHTSQIQWLKPDKTATPPPVANSDLARFCYKHWRLENNTAPSDSIKLKAQVLVVKVKAWDHEQARHEALDKAEAVIDLINAEHRANGFGVKRKVAVWREGSREVVQLTSSTVHVPFTRLLNISRNPSVDRSLRFATRAATERAGSMQTFFSWIALEYLGRGAQQSPQNTISAAVPKLVSLVSARQLIIEAWHELTHADGPEELPESVLRTIRRPGSPNPRKFNVNSLAHLLISDGNHLGDLAKVAGVPLDVANQAVSDFATYKKTLSEFSQYKLRLLRETLRSPDRLVKYMKEVEYTADRTMQRMRFVRNQTAHTASSNSTEHLALSKASLMILDSVFESVTRLSATPVNALITIRNKHAQVVSAVKKHSTPYLLPFDPKKPFLI